MASASSRLIVATGHRSSKLAGFGAPRTSELEAFALRSVCVEVDRDENTHFLTGMAMGWDLAVAWACVEAGVPFTAAVPFEGQSTPWPRSARASYFRLLSQASHVVVVTQEPTKTTLAIREALLRRNRWMVDQLVGEKDFVLALWNGSQGGTSHCINYASDRKKTVKNVWPDWEGFIREQGL